MTELLAPDQSVREESVPPLEVRVRQANFLADWRTKLFAEMVGVSRHEVDFLRREAANDEPIRLGITGRTEAANLIRQAKPLPGVHAPRALDVHVSELSSALDAASASGNVDAAIEGVIDFFEHRLSADDFATCETVLQQTDVTRLDAAVALAFLSMTYLVKDRLATARQGFRQRLERHLIDTRGEREAAQLLKGL